MKILVGMSGGVDSAVTAMLLKNAGHDVSGAIMYIWNEKNIFKGGDGKGCYSPNKKDDIESARNVAEQLKIPFHIIDVAEQYEKVVIDNFKSEYGNARTPNPCVRCNSLVKFGAFPALARKQGIEFDKFATGHYVRLSERDGRFCLSRAADPAKDQSYFLYRLNQAQLSSVLFPLGEFRKSEIRKLAAEFGLPVSERPDSQDFYSGDYRDILQCSEKKGNIVDETGKIVGQHSGFWSYTVGQRRGLGVAAKHPLYVTSLDAEKNIVYVGPEEMLKKTKMHVTDLNWSAISSLDAPRDVRIKVRSVGMGTAGSIAPEADGSVRVEFYETQKSPTPGQSAVFYDGELLLGGGLIEGVD